jgi:hypothetical protein
MQGPGREVKRPLREVTRQVAGRLPVPWATDARRIRDWSGCEGRRWEATPVTAVADEAATPWIHTA